MTTRHARPHVAASTWVVCGNTQFATVSFFPCLFSFFFDSFVSRTGRTVASVDRSGPKLARKCGFGQGCAFWGSRQWPSTFRVQTKKIGGGAWIGISSQICKKIKSSYLQNYASHLHKIWQADVAPNEKTSWVVLYDDVTNPRWRMAAILNFKKLL